MTLLRYIPILWLLTFPCCGQLVQNLTTINGVIRAPKNFIPTNHLVTNGMILALSNDVLTIIYTLGTNATNHANQKIDELNGVGTNTAFFGTNWTSSADSNYFSTSPYIGDLVDSVEHFVYSEQDGRLNIGPALSALGPWANLPTNVVSRYFGCLLMNSTNIVVCAGANNVYTNVAGTGFSIINTNGFYGSISGNSAALTNLVAGFYNIEIALSAKGSNGQEIEGEVFTNGVPCDPIGFKKGYDVPSRMDDMSMCGIIYLPANCRTDFRIQDGGAGASISIHRASLTITLP